jgi:hypothetical protein
MRWHYFPTGACLFTFLIYALAGDVISFQSATHKASLFAAYYFFSTPHRTLQLTECGCVMRELMYKCITGAAYTAAGFHLAGAYLASNRTASFISRLVASALPGARYMGSRGNLACF